MISLKILNNDLEAIEKFIKLGREKFNLIISIDKEDNNKKRETQGLSSFLDQQIRNTKIKNIKRAEESKKAMEKLGSLIDENTKNMPLSTVREEYYKNKAKMLWV